MKLKQLIRMYARAYWMDIRLTWLLNYTYHKVMLGYLLHGNFKMIRLKLKENREGESLCDED